MGPISTGIRNFCGLILLTWLLAACGGGGDDGGFLSSEPIDINATADSYSLPLNTFDFAPSRGGPFTTAITVQARLPNGAPIDNGVPAQFTITNGQESGSLYFLDTQNVDADGNHRAFSSASQELLSGSATMFLHATGIPGPVEITVSVPSINPNDNRLVTDKVVIEVGAGTSTGTSTEMFFIAPNTVVTDLDAIAAQLYLLDEAGQPVPDPAPGVNNVRVELLRSSIGAGESLVGVNAQGNRMVGQVLFLRTTNGVANFTLNSADLPGALILQASADQADNNVDNGIQNPLREAERVDVVNVIPDPNDPLAVTSSNLPPAETEVFYVGRLEAGGGVPPYTWMIRTGSLPPGLTLENDGLISGTPTQAGRYTFVAAVTDAAGSSIEVTTTIVVTQGVGPDITNNVLSDALINQSYGEVLIAQGGIRPYTWSIAEGNLPPGLGLNPQSGTITGTPTQVGQFSFLAQVTDVNGRTDQQLLVINVGRPEAPTLVTTTLDDAIRDTSYAVELTATGGTPPYTWAVVQGALPSGLALDNNRGTIIGTPTEAGSFSFVVQVTDANGRTDQQTLVIDVGRPEAPTLVTTTLDDAVLNTSYAAELTATGGTQPYSWAIVQGALPPGLALNNNRGTITGTPTETGTFSFVVEVTDANGRTDQEALTLTVTTDGGTGDFSIATQDLNGATRGLAYSDQLIASGGTPPYTWSISQGSLPPGLSLNAQTGTITGTPSTLGTFNFQVQATDANGQTTQQILIIVVGTPEEPQITTTQLDDGVVGQAYAEVLRVSGGIPPYAWSISQGNLPTGLNLNPQQGTITGTPTASGVFGFIAQVTDSNGNTGIEALSITVEGAGGGGERIIDFEGQGNAVLDFTQAESGATRFTYSHDGTGIFFVDLLDSNSNLLERLVSELGQTSGETVENLDPGDYLLRVEASDNWTIRVTQTVAGTGGDNPQVLFTIPANSADNVNTNADIIIRFTEDMDPITVSNSTITVVNTSTGDVFNMSSVTSESPTTYVVNNPFFDNFEPNRTYEVTITTSVRDVDGNPLAEAYTFSFTTGGATGAQISDVRLLADRPQLSSSSPDPVVLTAVIRDANNNVLPNVDVTFSADNDGTIQVTQSTTDDSGTATALLTTPGNKANRTITATATAGGLSDSVQIDVVGTTITVTGPTTASLGTNVQLTVSLEDSSGNAIANRQLTVTSSNNNPLNNNGPTVTITTGSNGQATVNLSADQGGPDTIIATNLGAIGVLELTVSTDDFKFTTVPTDVPLGSPATVTVDWTSSMVSVVGQPVEFSTTRGTPAAAIVLTDVNGQASFTITSESAGPATITANAVNGPSAEATFLFVAELAQALDVQATPAILGINPPGSSGEQSRVTATLRDSNNNPVKGKLVIFTLEEDITGGNLSPSSVVTDAFGRATTTYTAGSVSSAEDGVVIQATVPNPDPNSDVEAPLTDTVTLTVARRELFITLGTGNDISEPDSTRYAYPYSVLVTDAAGGPLANTEVTLSIVPTFYYKGFYTFPNGGTAWVATTTATCENEDIDRDGILDPEEDNGLINDGVPDNDNGLLEPGNVVTLSQSTVTTGSDGFAMFNVLYFQQFGNWIQVELIARASVSGTESAETANFRLPLNSDDLTDQNVEPPGNPSPFGTSNSCFDDL